jgi:hypothetical protein
MVYTLERMDLTSIHFKAHSLIHEGGVRDIKYIDLAKTFSSFKGKLSCMVTADISKFQPPMLESMQIDIHKAQLFVQLMGAAEKMIPIESRLLHFCLTPKEVRAQVGIPKGALKLLAATDLNKIVVKSQTSIFKVKSPNGQAFFLDAPQKVSSANPVDWKLGQQFSAAWWVATTSDQDEANMKLATISHNGWVLPMYQNIKARKVGDRLAVLDQPMLKSARRR